MSERHALPDNVYHMRKVNNEEYNIRIKHIVGYRCYFVNGL